jgi:hypothetical protein
MHNPSTHNGSGARIDAVLLDEEAEDRELAVTSGNVNWAKTILKAWRG